MMDVRRLRLLCELSFRGTIAATAQALDYTPSAVSQQLAVLEREAGVSLLERDGRRVILTPAALRLVERARHVIDDLESARAELHADREHIDGEVRVGAFPSAALALVVPAMAGLAARHPNLVPAVRETDPDEGIQLLRGGALDLLVAYEYDLLTPIPDGGMERLSLLNDPLLIAVPPDHRLAGRSRVVMSELADERWVAGLPGTPFGTLTQRAGRAAGFEPRIVHRAREFALQRALVAAGLGIALVPTLARAQADTQVVYLRVRSPAIVRRVQLLARQGAGRRPAVATCITALRRRAGEH